MFNLLVFVLFSSGCLLGFLVLRLGFVVLLIDLLGCVLNCINLLFACC